MELSYSLHLGNDKNKSIKARQEAKNTPSGTTSKNNNAIQNVKQLGKVNHHNLRQYDNNQELIKTIKKYLNEGMKYYSDDEVTNVSRNFMLSEMVREKVLRLTKDEVPHSVTCLVEEYNEEENSVHLRVLVIVDRDNLKKIIIGKNGQMLKEIGTKARIDMEEFLGKKVFLETYVKTIDNWKDREKYLTEFGLNELE